MRFSFVLLAGLALFAGLGLTDMSRAADREGWIKLLDGKSLDGWKKYDGKPLINGKGWVADDGVLSLREKGGGDIITRDQFENFELEFDWKVEPGSNSGVMYLVKTGDPAPYYSGPEYQILDDARHPDGKNPKTSAAALYALVAPKDKKLNPPGEWNTGKVVLKNGHLEHWLNGKKVLEIQMHSDRWKKLVENSKFNQWKQFAQAQKGHICLQDHGDPVSFKNLRIRRLED